MSTVASLVYGSDGVSRVGAPATGPDDGLADGVEVTFVTIPEKNCPTPATTRAIWPVAP